MTLPDDVIRLTATFGPGTRIVCPFCNGGSGQEKSMIVWSETNYKCYRASCGKGNYSAAGNIRRPEKQPKYHTGPTRLLSPDQANWFRAKFYLDQVPPGTLLDDDAERYIHPVRGPNQQLRGVIARSYYGATPKTLAFQGLRNEPWMHYVPAYGRDTRLVTILVEDVVSAAKVAQTELANAVSLMGTHLDVERVNELSAHCCYELVLIALDKDATGKAIKYCAKYGDMFTTMRVLPLQRDFKDMTMAESKKVIQDAINTASAWRNTQQQVSI